MANLSRLEVFGAAALVTVFTAGCGCGEDPDVETNPPPPGGELGGLAAQCRCVIEFHANGPVDDPEPQNRTAGFCLPEEFEADPEAFCSTVVSDVVRVSFLRTGELVDDRVCEYVDVVATCHAETIPGQPEGTLTREAEQCVGDCPSVPCNDTNCSPAQLETLSCACSAPSACGGFSDSAACRPGTVTEIQEQGMMSASAPAPLAAGDGYECVGCMVGPSELAYTLGGTWDSSQSSLAVSVTVEVGCAPIVGCLTASDSASPSAQGSFNLFGAPCPGESCAVGIESSIGIDNFDLEFSVGPFSETAELRDLSVDVVTAPNTVVVDAAGNGEIPANSMTIYAKGREGSDVFLVRSTQNQFPIPISIDWENRVVAMTNVPIDLGAEGSAVANLVGTFGLSETEALTATDTDGDGVADVDDNCILVPNPNQETIDNPIISVSNVESCEEPETSAGTPQAEDICTGLPVTLTSDEPADFSPGVTVVTWTATDAFGQQNTAEQVIEQRPALIAKNGIRVTDRASTAGPSSLPTLVALGSAGIEVGVEALVADLVSVGNITLKDGAVSLGSLTSANDVILGDNVTVVGAINEFTTPTFGTFPEFGPLNFVPGTVDVIVEPDQETSITPGSFGKLIIKTRGNVRMAPGEYVFSSVQLEPHATVTLEGATAVNVASKLIWRGEFVTDGPDVAPLSVTYKGNQAAVLETSSALRLIAPNANAVIGGDSGLAFVGTVAAKNIELRPDTTFTCETVPGPAP